jgi:uncharacterized protein YejL (UPF0352 family)
MIIIRALIFSLMVFGMMGGVVMDRKVASAQGPRLNTIFSATEYAGIKRGERKKL